MGQIWWTRSDHKIFSANVDKFVLIKSCGFFLKKLLYVDYMALIRSGLSWQNIGDGQSNEVINIKYRFFWHNSDTVFLIRNRIAGIRGRKPKG